MTLALVVCCAAAMLQSGAPRASPWRSAARNAVAPALNCSSDQPCSADADCAGAAAGCDRCVPPPSGINGTLPVLRCRAVGCAAGMQPPRCNATSDCTAGGDGQNGTSSCAVCVGGRCAAAVAPTPAPAPAPAPTYAPTFAPTPRPTPNGSSIPVRPIDVLTDDDDDGGGESPTSTVSGSSIIVFIAIVVGVAVSLVAARWYRKGYDPDRDDNVRYFRLPRDDVDRLILHRHERLLEDAMLGDFQEQQQQTGAGSGSRPSSRVLI